MQYHGPDSKAFWMGAEPMVRYLVLFVLSVTLAAAGCGGLDTSWHVKQGKIHEADPVRDNIKSGEEGWRFVRYPDGDEVLPDGKKAGYFDVIWEWKMELVNSTNEPIEMQAQYFLVTADKVYISGSADPIHEDKWATLAPGEKKVFTGQGLMERRHISRIVRGRGRFRNRLLQEGPAAPGPQGPAPAGPEPLAPDDSKNARGGPGGRR